MVKRIGIIIGVIVFTWVSVFYSPYIISEVKKMFNIGIKDYVEREEGTSLKLNSLYYNRIQYDDLNKVYLQNSRNEYKTLDIDGRFTDNYYVSSFIYAVNDTERSSYDFLSSVIDLIFRIGIYSMPIIEFILLGTVNLPLTIVLYTILLWANSPNIFEKYEIFKQDSIKADRLFDLIP